MSIFPRDPIERATIFLVRDNYALRITAQGEAEFFSRWYGQQVVVHRSLMRLAVRTQRLLEGEWIDETADPA